MKPFKVAVIPESEIIGIARGWLALWRQGEVHTLRVTGPDCTEAEALVRLIVFTKRTVEGHTYANDKYKVSVRSVDNGWIHLLIRPLDLSARHDWREFQQIKNELVGPEHEAIELYPAESRLVDNANQFHLWCLEQTGARIPVGWPDRMVSDHAIGKGQRPFGQEEPVSPTPRTDEAIVAASDADGAREVCELCGQLEQENARLQAEIESRLT